MISETRPGAAVGYTYDANGYLKSGRLLFLGNQGEPETPFAKKTMAPKTGPAVSTASWPVGGTKTMHTLIVFTAVMAMQTTATQHLENLAQGIESLSFPASAGVWREGPTLRTQSSFIRADERANSRSTEVFGRALGDYWVFSVARRRFGDGGLSPGAIETLVVRPFPTKEHAYMDALSQMIDGVSSTKWPKPGFPVLTSKTTKKLGDRVWGFRGSSQESLVTVADRAVLRFELFYLRTGKEPRVLADVVKEWDTYLAKVVEKVRACPLSK